MSLPQLSASHSRHSPLRPLLIALAAVIICLHANAAAVPVVHAKTGNATLPDRVISTGWFSIIWGDPQPGQMRRLLKSTCYG